MRTLFAKILIWFWLAFAVMIGAFALLESIDRERRLQLPSGNGGPFDLVTLMAEDALRREGRAGLVRVVDGMEHRARWTRSPQDADSARRDDPASVRESARFETGIEPGPASPFVREMGKRESAFDSGAGIVGLPGPRPPRLGARVTSERLYVLDGEGTELRGRPVPHAVTSLARAALESTTGRVIEERQGQMRIGYRVEAPTAGRFALVVVRPAPPRFLPLLPRDLWLKLGILLAIGAIGCYALARYMTAPIQRLRRATQRVASGDLEARVGARKDGRGDELEELGQDFDRMAERIETAVSVQRRLLRDISHELRSPLARLQIGIGILRQLSTDERAQTTIGRLEDEAGRMGRMIQDLLMISRLESREWTRARERVYVSVLVADLAADAAFEAGTRGSTVQVRLLDPVVVEGSTHLLRSAIDNVVRNAVRHTRAGTAVEIEVRANPGAVPPYATVSVRDHGIGVPEDQLRRIFEPFYRVDDSRSQGTGGAGLGLAIARRAVEEHGGSIVAERARGGGLAVVMRLPLDSPLPAVHDA